MQRRGRWPTSAQPVTHTVCCIAYQDVQEALGQKEADSLPGLLAMLLRLGGGARWTAWCIEDVEQNVQVCLAL